MRMKSTLTPQKLIPSRISGQKQYMVTICHTFGNSQNSVRDAASMINVAKTEENVYLQIAWAQLNVTFTNNHSSVPVSYAHHRPEILINEALDKFDHGISNRPQLNHLAQAFHDENGHRADDETCCQKTPRSRYRENGTAGLKDSHADNTTEGDELQGRVSRLLSLFCYKECDGSPGSATPEGLACGDI